MKLKTKIVRIELAEPVEFEWDEWNIRKNQIKHKVSANEAEEVLNDPEKKIFRDVFHSRREKRLIVIGSAKNGRTLHIVFTLRSKRVKVISARDLNRKEKYLYI